MCFVECTACLEEMPYHVVVKSQLQDFISTLALPLSSCVTLAMRTILASVCFFTQT